MEDPSKARELWTCAFPRVVGGHDHDSQCRTQFLLRPSAFGMLIDGRHPKATSAGDVFQRTCVSTTARRVYAAEGGEGRTARFLDRLGVHRSRRESRDGTFHRSRLSLGNSDPRY